MPPYVNEMSKSYTLYINAYSPETIPMARLAEYMQNLAVMLGHESGVHFEELRPGSTQLAARIDHEYVPKVETQLGRVRGGDAPPEALKAQTEIDRLLAEDNATGFLYEGTDLGAQVIQFPGVTRPKPVTYGPFRQEGSLDGVVISVGGADQTAHVQLQNGDLKYTGIETDRETARRLAKHMYEAVRVMGTGRWLRDASGAWLLKKFTMTNFVVLEPETLVSAVEKLRAIEGGEWGDMNDPVAALKALRDSSGGIH